MRRLHLYIDSLTPIFKARVDMASITYPVSELVYDTITLGAYTDIQPDCTLLLGTSEGSDDLGRVRVKSLADADSIPISRAGKGVEDGTLWVQNNAYITVLDDYRVWAKIPYFLADEEGLTVTDFKDSDVEVGTYNEDIPPVSNCGPWAIGYVDSGTNLLTVQFPRDGVNPSFAMADGASISTYDWDVKDGTITVGTSASSVITATFPVGRRWVALTVVDSNGEPHTSRCLVVALDPDDDASFKSFRVKQTLEIKGSTLDIEIFDDLDRDDYPDGTPVILWYGEASDPGDRDHIKFAGWLNNESHTVNRVREGLNKGTRMSAVDALGRMEVLPGFPQALSREDDAQFWALMPTLDMHKALYYLAHWHSTLLGVADFILPDGLKDYDSMRIDSGAGTLFSQIDQQAQKIVPDHYLTCNVAGQVNVRRDWRLDDEADRPAVTKTFDVTEWNNLQYEYSRHPKVHVLRSGAILASTDWVVVDGEDTLPLAFSIAPGDTSSFSQGTQEVTQNEGLALTQEDLNKSEGHRYAMLNSRFGKFTWSEPSGDGFWDVEPGTLNRTQLNLNALVATYRGLPFTEATGMVESMSIDYSRTKLGLAINTKITWVKEEEGFPALTYDPDTGTVTDETVIVPPSFGLTVSADLVVGVGGLPYLCRTSNFTNASPTWDKVDIDFGAESIPSSFNSFVVDPFSPGYLTGSGAINGFAVSQSAIWKIEDMFAASPTATLLHTLNSANMGSASSKRRLIAASFGEFQSTITDNPWLMVTCIFDAVGVGANANDGIWEIHSTDGGQTWSTEQKINSFANSSSPKYIQQEPIIWLSPRTPGKGILFAHDSNTTTFGYITTDWGDTWTKMTDPLVENSAGYGGGIHVPWEDNVDESLVYHGHYATGSPGLWKLKKVTNTSIVDITPTHLGNGFGPFHGLFSLRAYDNDRQYMLVSGVTDGGTAGSSQDEAALFISTNGGTNWTNVLYTADLNDFGDGLGWQAAFTNSDPSKFYVWGGSPLVPAMAIGFSDDGGATVDDKSGNLPTLASSDSDINGFIAIAGGPS